MDTSTDKIKIFYSYSHADEPLRKKLDDHLAFLKRDNVLVWHDREIIAGHDLNETIQKELKEADLILLLISSSFLSSFYCYEIEMKKAMEKHNNNDAIIVPILLSDCVWQKAPFAKLLMTPHDAKPINNSKYWTTPDEALTNVAMSIEKTVGILKNKKIRKDNQISPLLIVPENDSDDEILLKAIKVLKQSRKNINYNTTKEDLAKTLNVKSKLFDELFKEMDNQIDFISSKKELMYSSVLFDKIYTSEKLDTILTLEIQKIREKNIDYKWYDRSIIVSALTLSLIQFKFDEKKANILLDFVTEFEPKVWERAITGLTIAILYQKNRSWIRSTNLIRRLENLRDNQKIQDSLKIIDYILKNELYKGNLYNPNLYKMELFSNPMNCFVPFYENNEILINAIDNKENNDDFDANHFQSFINNVPLMDSIKYSICIGLNTKKISNETMEQSKLDLINSSLSLSNDFSPFQNLISEFYFFFENYPSKLIDDVFKKQLLLSQTELKNYVLNKVTKLLVEANTFYQAKKYTEAINKYIEVLRIEKTHKDARWQLGNCYLARRDKINNDIQESLKIFLDFEKEGKENVSDSLIVKISEIYNRLEKWENSLEYCNKIENIDIANSFGVLNLKADNYCELKDFDNAEAFCKLAAENIIDEGDMYSLATIYSNLDKFQEALELMKKALKVKPDDEYYLTFLASIYFDLFEWNLSIEILEKAIKINNKSSNLNLSIGRSYLFSGKKTNEAKEIFERLINTNSDCKDVGYGNLGHFYLIENSIEKAIEYYTSCLIEINNTDDFNKKMQKDLKFILSLGINEDLYNEIKNKAISKYNEL